jgi:hypothetical protein
LPSYPATQPPSCPATESAFERREYVEFVEHVVTTHPQRLSLNFEVPAVLHGASAQVTPHGHFTVAIGARGSSQAFTRGLKLANERFERTADALKRGRSLFVELAQQLLVPFTRRPPHHDFIVADTTKTRPWRARDETG